jgi:hypothetical protein
MTAIALALLLAAAPLHASEPATAETRWRTARILPWYGPGLWNNRTACGHRMDRWLRGVAHRSLPCGTLIEFRLRDGHRVTVPVVDRGPYPEMVGIPRRLMPLDVTARTMCYTLQKPYGKYPKAGCHSLRDVKWRVVRRGR